MTKSRLFIAINLPNNLKEKLSKLLSELEKRNKKLPVKWVNSNQLHLTLHFLGYLEKSQISRIASIQPIIKKYKPFKMRVQGIDGFPNLKSPRVIFLNCQEINTQTAKIIQKNLGQIFKQLNIKIDNRPWHEHITLARVKNKCRPNLPKVTIADNEFKVAAIELMESKLAPTGAKYSVVETYKLG